MADVETRTTYAWNSPELGIFYDKVFLEVAKETPRYDVLCTKKSIPTNAGKVIYWTRQTPRATFTTPLTEATTPYCVSTSAENVSATVAEFGDWEKISSLFSLTTRDAGLKERVALFGQQAGETIDDLILAELQTGATQQLAGAKALVSSIAASDTLSVVELRKAVTTLKRNKAPRFADGYYKAVISVQGVYELLGDTNQGNFTAVNTYKSPEDIKKGEIGRIAGVIVHEANNEGTESSTVTVYHNFVAGRDAIAMVDISGKGNASVMLKTPGANDTSNPLDMYSTLAVKIKAFAVKTLNSNWLINIHAA